MNIYRIYAMQSFHLSYWNILIFFTVLILFGAPGIMIYMPFEGRKNIPFLRLNFKRQNIELPRGKVMSGEFPT